MKRPLLLINVAFSILVVAFVFVSVEWYDARNTTEEVIALCHDAIDVAESFRDQRDSAFSAAEVLTVKYDSIQNATK